MEDRDIFANLKQAFEEAVEYTVANGMCECEVREIRRSELLQAVVNEASLRLKERNVPYQDGIADVVTGRRKYQEPIISNEIEHDYQYLQSILSNYDIGRLKHAVAVGRPIIVEGLQGPTGKTTLIRYLKELGAMAIQYNLSEVFTLNEPLKSMNSKPFKSLL
ncbi:hypothetical protein LSPCS325_39480 [Lysinibacillus sp. CTST325]